MFNSRSIGRKEFVASTCKDPWIRTLSGLFIEPCCDFKNNSKNYVTKNNE
jgi:hypothetical protein